MKKLRTKNTKNKATSSKTLDYQANFIQSLNRLGEMVNKMENNPVCIQSKKIKSAVIKLDKLKEKIRVLNMMNIKKTHSTKNKIQVKTGSTKEFFSSVKGTMRALDAGLPISERKTIIFEDPIELAQLFKPNNIKIIERIRIHPDSITNIAKGLRRERSAVYRDIHELERFGLVKTHEEINPGHGRRKVVELTSTSFKFEAEL